MITKKEVAIEIDASVVTGPVLRNWRYIGYDENNYTHTPEGEELLSKFGKMEQEPCYVRAHHMLCTGNLHGIYKWGSTNAYMEDFNGNAVYCWETVDKILDVLLKNNCKPFFELGFMPLDLVDPIHFDGMGEGQKYEEYKRTFCACPPKDYEKWQSLIIALVRHCIDKYSEAEVLTWYWELWNEPDIFYWRGSREEFFKLFDYTEKAIHIALPAARLGGPGTTDPNPGSHSLQFFEAFLDHCANGYHYVTGEKGVRLDFVTFHTKGGGFPFHLHAKKETPSVQKQVAQVHTGLASMNRFGYGSCEVVLSEADPDGWAAGGIHDNPNMKFRNTEYYASYVACGYHHIEKAAKKWNAIVRPLAWAFLFRGERCFEGTRTFSTQGIDKPVLNMFRIFSKLGSSQLQMFSSGENDIMAYADRFGSNESPDISGIATRSDDGKIQIVIYSHHDDWDIHEQCPVTVSIRGFESVHKAEVNHYRIDHEHSNAHSVWESMECPDYPTAEQYNTLKERDGLELFSQEKGISIIDGVFKLSLKMPTHSVSLLEIIPE